MPLHSWDSIEKERLNPLVARQAIHSKRMTVARLHLSQGALVPEHSHDNEQITLCERGRVRFRIDGVETVVQAGEAMEIPSGARHSVEALEDSVAVDIFSPRREDWIRGDDAYLRR